QSLCLRSQSDRTLTVACRPRADTWGCITYERSSRPYAIIWGMLCRILVIAFLASPTFPADWMQFRGPNGSGVGDATHLPTKLGPANAVWKTAVPWVYSTP